MANLTGPQPQVLYCPTCKHDLRNVPREEMRSRPRRRADGTFPTHTHTYECQTCHRRFEINQER